MSNSCSRSNVVLFQMRRVWFLLLIFLLLLPLTSLLASFFRISDEVDQSQRMIHRPPKQELS